MQTRNAVIVVAAALALAACGKDDDRNAPQPASSGSTASGSSAAAPAQPQVNTPTTPANTPPPQSMAEKREGANPVQGQVDPKQGEQHKDFQRQGDSAGPRSPETSPKPGG